MVFNHSDPLLLKAKIKLATFLSIKMTKAECVVIVRFLVFCCFLWAKKVQIWCIPECMYQFSFIFLC